MAKLKKVKHREIPETATNNPLYTSKFRTPGTTPLQGLSLNNSPIQSPKLFQQNPGKQIQITDISIPRSQDNEQKDKKVTEKEQAYMITITSLSDSLKQS